MNAPVWTSPRMQEVAAYAQAISDAGADMGLPYIAISADIGSPVPMYGPDGRPFAETLFRWLDPDLRYWEDRVVALRAAFVHTTRACAEPFYYADGKLATWRPNRALEAINDAGPIDSMGVGAGIVAPAYRASGAIGVVIWASPDTDVAVPAIFAERAEALHALALKFTSAYDDALAGTTEAPVKLTRREIHCLKWAAAGKTDQEIGEIVGISLPTVRFHINNASEKMHVMGRSQAVRRAATLGYIGAGPPAKRLRG
jgi:DNA-binding CsgD family transcriptional regulator